jgi:hypothetical protein
MTTPYHAGNEPKFDSVAGPSYAVLRAVSEDLKRLDTLLDDAIARLLESFSNIQQLAASSNSPEISKAAVDAVTALQFQDMATQLISHCRKHLADPEDPTATIPFSATHFYHQMQSRGPVSANGTGTGPVEQSDLASGSIDLF